MGKVKQLYVDLENEGPDQEPPVGAMSVALPILIEIVCVSLMFACAFVWLALASGRA